MSSSEYTPTTEQVREQYTREEPPTFSTVQVRRAEFDRWLAQHDAEVRAALVEPLNAYADMLDNRTHDPRLRLAPDAVAARIRDLLSTPTTTEES